ncbi:MAG: uroporphyrinogen-III synthase [Pontixanthobacter sp.]
MIASGAPPIIVLRPEPGLAATLAAGRRAGLAMHGFRLFDIVALPWELPDPARFDALLIGSANVFRHGGTKLARLRHLPVHAVGQTTADHAQKAGFDVARVGVGGLQAVIDADAGRTANYLRLGGEARVLLRPAGGQSVHDIVVYRAASRSLPDESRALLLQNPIVALHSAAAAARFQSECDRLGVRRGGITLACLGRRIADAVGEGWHRIVFAPQPDDTALLELLVRLCKSNDRP